MFKRELRLVVTENCNYNCTFCHKEGMKKYEKPKLTPEDYAFLFKTCKDKYNWDEVTLTGGEPFVRIDVDNIVNELKKQGAKITIVTNGELINKHVEALSNIDRINLSIHTLNKDKYDKIVQKKDKLNEVLKNIAAIRTIYPYLNIRLNAVVVKGQNDTKEDIEEYIAFAKRIKASIKFVELFGQDEDMVSVYDIATMLNKMGFKYKDICNVSKQELTDGETTIVLSRIFCANAILQIDPEKYCNKYNDLFITPEGNINICRNSKEDIPIYEEIKNRDTQALIKKIDVALNNIGKNCTLCKERKKLAINGGIPVFAKTDENRFIHPKTTKEIENAVINQLHESISIYDNNGIFGKFEKEFADYHNAKYGLTFSSGTAALWAMYEGINLKEGDEVICPCYTFFATVTPILFAGATPVFVDTGEDGNIDVKQISKKITSKTKAIVVTHMWGYPCEMDELKKIAKQNNLYLLEDCSHAHGASYRDKKVGSIGDAAVFSLQGQKIITGGEGGILITNNKSIKDRALLLGHYNKRCKVELDKQSDLYKYAITGKGMKLRAHPIAIRMASEYFKQLDQINEIKNEYAKFITRELEDINGIEVLKAKEYCNNSWYAIIIKYNQDKMYGVSRERFVEALHKEGAIEVDTPNSTCPLDNLELFKNPGKLFDRQFTSINTSDDFINANKFYNSIIKLPVWYTKEEQDIVIKYVKAIKKVCNNIKELI